MKFIIPKNGVWLNQGKKRLEIKGGEFNTTDKDLIGKLKNVKHVKQASSKKDAE